MVQNLLKMSSDEIILVLHLGYRVSYAALHPNVKHVCRLQCPICSIVTWFTVWPFFSLCYIVLSYSHCHTPTHTTTQISNQQSYNQGKVKFGICSLRLNLTEGLMGVGSCDLLFDLFDSEFKSDELGELMCLWVCTVSPSLEPKATIQTSQNSCPCINVG